MTLYEFNALPDERQVALVFDQARFLATRWEEEDAVNRYVLPGGAVCGNFLRYLRQRNLPATGFYPFGSPGRRCRGHSITPEEVTVETAGGPVEAGFLPSCPLSIRGLFPTGPGECSPLADQPVCYFY